MNAFWLRGAAAQATRYQGLCNRNGDIRFGFAEEKDVGILDSLNEEVVRSLMIPGRFMRQDRPFFEDLLRCPDACIYMARQNGVAAAYSIGARACDAIPAFDENTGAIGSIGLLFGTAVDPPLRGQGIQRIMIALRIETLRKIGCKTIQTTVSPFNRHSLINLMDSGFKIVALKKVLDGHYRFIMERTADFLHFEDADTDAATIPQKHVDLGNEESIGTHEAALSSGWIGTRYYGDYSTDTMQIIYESAFENGATG